MKELKPLNKRVVFQEGLNHNDPEFRLYDIYGYTFEENLAFPDGQDGVYIFLEFLKPQMDMDRLKVESLYTMLYCGKTIDLRTRFDQHQKKEKLSQREKLCIAVAYCEDEKEITSLENKLLDYYNFSINCPEKNKGKVNPTVSVIDD